eukprot:3655496-Pyramimonas_sp.AAC.1
MLGRARRRSRSPRSRPSSTSAASRPGPPVWPGRRAARQAAPAARTAPGPLQGVRRRPAAATPRPQTPRERAAEVRPPPGVQVLNAAAVRTARGREAYQ